MFPFLLLAAIVADSLSWPPVSREFRGVWVATVENIDWPSKPGLPAAVQQAELTRILDAAAALRLNAILLQVRPAGDALYASSLEPWSEYLSGAQGTPPSPLWDPLAFAVQQAHARGLELHAWFNPFRARDAGRRGALSPLHFAQAQPAMAKQYGSLLWFDPGEAAVRAHTIRVILDVVQRYDIDGVHLDDYFYPYPQRDASGRLIAFPDDEGFGRYRQGGGTLARDDWRRGNIDQFIEALNTRIHAAKPWVKFGISPVGIWRPGFPAGVNGLGGFGDLYADARRWLNLGWADYFSPQLYWPMNARAQAYGTLLKWWGDENLLGRHLWPGNFSSRAGTNASWPASELVNQVLATRADRTATGNIHFSVRALMQDQGGLATLLAAQAYTESALVPASLWLPGTAPIAPRFRLVAGDAGTTACLGDAARSPPRWWVLRLKQADEWKIQVLPGDLRQLPLAGVGAGDSLALSAVDRTGREGGVTLGTAATGC